MFSFQTRKIESFVLMSFNHNENYSSKYIGSNLHECTFYNMTCKIVIQSNITYLMFLLYTKEWYSVEYVDHIKHIFTQHKRYLEFISYFTCVRKIGVKHHNCWVVFLWRSSSRYFISKHVVVAALILTEPWIFRPMSYDHGAE